MSERPETMRGLIADLQAVILGFGGDVMLRLEEALSISRRLWRVNRERRQQFEDQVIELRQAIAENEALLQENTRLRAEVEAAGRVAGGLRDLGPAEDTP